MKRLSRIPGYSRKQIQRYNEMNDVLSTYEMELEENPQAIKPDFTEKELEQFNHYYEFAMADEKKRWDAMNGKAFEDFTPDEIDWLDHMQDVLTTYNDLLGRGIDPMVLPDFSDIEMLEHSQYRQLWLARQCEDSLL